MEPALDILRDNDIREIARMMQPRVTVTAPLLLGAEIDPRVPLRKYMAAQTLVELLCIAGGMMSPLTIPLRMACARLMRIIIQSAPVPGFPSDFTAGSRIAAGQVLCWAVRARMRDVVAYYLEHMMRRYADNEGQFDAKNAAAADGARDFIDAVGVAARDGWREGCEFMRAFSRARGIDAVVATENGPAMVAMFSAANGGHMEIARWAHAWYEESCARCAPALGIRNVAIIVCGLAALGLITPAIPFIVRYPAAARSETLARIASAGACASTDDPVITPTKFARDEEREYDSANYRAICEWAMGWESLARLTPEESNKFRVDCANAIAKSSGRTGRTRILEWAVRDLGATIGFAHAFAKAARGGWRETIEWCDAYVRARSAESTGNPRMKISGIPADEIYAKALAKAVAHGRAIDFCEFIFARIMAWVDAALSARTPASARVRKETGKIICATLDVSLEMAALNHRRAHCEWIRARHVALRRERDGLRGLDFGDIVRASAATGWVDGLELVRAWMREDGAPHDMEKTACLETFRAMSPDARGVCDWARDWARELHYVPNFDALLIESASAASVDSDADYRRTLMSRIERFRELGARDFNGMLRACAGVGWREGCERAREWGATDFAGMRAVAKAHGRGAIVKLAREWMGGQNK